MPKSFLLICSIHIHGCVDFHICLCAKVKYVESGDTKESAKKTRKDWLGEMRCNLVSLGILTATMSLVTTCCGIIKIGTSCGRSWIKKPRTSCGRSWRNG
ncbi:hypothetical protein Hanom_Chr17g01541781 [Helianthus anomalus]